MPLAASTSRMIGRGRRLTAPPVPHDHADRSHTRRFGSFGGQVERSPAAAATVADRTPKPDHCRLQAPRHSVECDHGLHWTMMVLTFELLSEHRSGLRLALRLRSVANAAALCRHCPWIQRPSPGARPRSSAAPERSPRAGRGGLTAWTQDSRNAPCCRGWMTPRSPSRSSRVYHAAWPVPVRRPAAAPEDAAAGCDKPQPALCPVPDCCRGDRTANALDA